MTSCGGGGSDENDEATSYQPQNNDSEYWYQCIDYAGDFSYTANLGLWVVDSKGNKIYNEPFDSEWQGTIRNSLATMLNYRYGIDARNIDKDISVLCECTYNFGKLTAFIPINKDIFHTATNSQHWYFITPFSDAYTKFYFENKKQGDTVKKAMDDSKAAMSQIFPDTPYFLTNYAYIPPGSLPSNNSTYFAPLMNELLFLMKYNGLNDLGNIQTDLVNQYNSGIADSYYKQLVYAAFIHRRSNLLNNGSFDKVDSSNNPISWNFYNDTSGKSVFVDKFISNSDTTLHLEMISNRNEKNEGDAGAYGFYQERQIEGYNLNKLYISISYQKMLGKLENEALADAAGAASILIEYINRNGYTVGWTNLVNTSKLPFADVPMMATPSNLDSTPTTKVLRIPTVNRDLILNLGRELDFFNLPNKNDITKIRIWLIVTDYIGHNYASGYSIYGLLYNAVVQPDCNNCKAEAAIESVNLFSLP